MSKYLKITGARENNLKNLDLQLEHDQLVVITGLSGSGKSTLAFDTLYAEGGRRYIETFSPYTRQFLDRLKKPDFDRISGVRPALALEQSNRVINSRSTVGTVTEVNEYLKLVFTHLAKPKCPKCGVLVENNSREKIGQDVLELSKTTDADTIILGFRLNAKGLASLDSLKASLLSQGYTRFFDSQLGSIDDLTKLSGSELIVSARIKAKSASIDTVLESISPALDAGKGHLELVFLKDKKLVSKTSFSEGMVCGPCQKSFESPTPSLFSFNSPLGACPTCKGFGYELKPDIDKIIPDRSLSISEGAVHPFQSSSKRREQKKLIEFCFLQGLDTQKPISEFTKKELSLISEGKGTYKGIFGFFERIKKKQYKMHVRVFLARYRGQFLCSDCKGARLTAKAREYNLSGKTISDIWDTPISELPEFFKALENKDLPEAVSRANESLIERLNYLSNIGLGYLTLGRQSRTLSGGEAQRVGLTSILGAGLVNTLLVLDEPTIGLHSQDTERLIKTFKHLRSKGNSLLVVEHDKEVVRAANKIIDLGPSSGGDGGEIIFNGTPNTLLKSASTDSKNSPTGAALKELNFPSKATGFMPKEKLALKKAQANNLKNINVEIPLGGIVCLCGVSGSGKSSLVSECLLPAWKDKNSKRLSGMAKIGDIVLVDQTPVGKTPRANPATYTKVWDTIRECLADTDAAIQLGLGKSAFSFNVEGGRCPECKGAGQHKVEMQFLADVFVECEACQGSRFQEEILDIRFHGKNVADFLGMSLSEALSFFENLDDEGRARQIARGIKPLVSLGLDYLSLGHPLNALSGGEAQRVKLASYLAQKNKEKLLFVLDEPSTGLHSSNVKDLFAVFVSLKEAGHSVLVIEHNLEIVANSDWLLELGPQGGEQGGQLIASGAPLSLLNSNLKTPTLESLRAEKESHSHLTRKSNRSKNDADKLKNTASKRASKSFSEESNSIAISGARHHNLKNLSLEVPVNKIVVVTGVSGSGKSTLAFDLIFNEGQRRYIDCLSPYARQFMKQLERPEVDEIENLPPTVAVSQRSSLGGGLSTISTVSEIYQYLRLLFCKAGTQLCPEHQLPLSSLSPKEIAKEIISCAKGQPVFLFAPIITGRKGFHGDVFERALNAEITEARVDEKVTKIKPGLRLARHKLHWISLLTSSIAKPEKNLKLLEEAIKQTSFQGGGTVEVSIGKKDKEPLIFSADRVCPKCKKGFRELDPQDFSFSSKRGACKRCEGLGRITLKGESVTCPDCEGARIKAIGRSVTIGEKAIHQLGGLKAPDLLDFLAKLKLPKRLKPVTEPLLSELKHRLQVIEKVGLGYLALDRDSSSLSGGEAQRLRLAKALGSPLSGVCYVLDEPTIGLHPKDQEILFPIFKELRDAGNSVIVVEHDEDIIRAADHVIDIGPGGGKHGGELVFSGSPKALLKSKVSATGAALKKISLEEKKRKKPHKKKKLTDFIELSGINKNNIVDQSAKFPLEALTVVCGVSGAGKSSLVHGALVPAVLDSFKGGKLPKKRTYKEIKGLDNLEKITEVSQTPIGKTPSSTPASYLGVLGELRKLYANTPEAKVLGFDHSYFSYNTGKGKCEECSGKGFLKIPMSFLPDAITNCPVCQGLRYQTAVSQVTYQGLSIGELLSLSMEEAYSVLKNHKKISRVLEYVLELGLGYISLGQPSYTLSGGEAQRLHLAKELGARSATNCLYILDEPSIGLHLQDVWRLTSVLRKLVEKGNTVVVIEHNQSVLTEADWLISLGPCAGDRGGKVSNRAS